MKSWRGRCQLVASAACTSVPFKSWSLCCTLCALTVRQVPLMATLAPICIPSVFPGGKLTWMERKFCFCCSSVTLPLPWTMPAASTKLLAFLSLCVATGGM